MAKTKKMKTLLKSKYIPPELLTLIFATLPVKTLVRFRSVCKSWCSIIDHPDFVSMHLKLCKTNIDSKKLLAFEWFRDRDYCLLTVRQSNTLRKSAQIIKSYKDFTVFGKCNGLLLMSDSKELRLWNPSIRKSLAIPPCPLSYNLSHHVVYLFGYANDSKDYKIIAVSFEVDELSKTNLASNMSVAVYTLKDQQRRLRNNHDLNISCWYFADMFPYNAYQRVASIAVIFQGAAYWIKKDPNNPDSYAASHLVSFDFELENFTYLEPPFDTEEDWSSTYMLLLGESLAIFNSVDETVRIWVMEQRNRTTPWSLWFSGPLNLDFYDFFIHATGIPVFYSNSDVGRCFLSEKYSYNIDTGQVRKVGRQMSNIHVLDTYLESLVLCKGYEAKDLTSFL